MRMRRPPIQRHQDISHVFSAEVKQSWLFFGLTGCRQCHISPHLKLRWRKEWIWSERPINIHAIVRLRAGLDRGLWSGISLREQGPIRSLISFTLQRNLCASILWAWYFGLLVEASLFTFTGWFHIHLFVFI